MLRTTDGGRTWRPQLVSSETPSAEGLAAIGASAAFLLADSNVLLFTTSGGDRGRALEGHDSHRAAHRAAAVRDPPQRPGARRTRGSPGARGAARARRERLGPTRRPPWRPTAPSRTRWRLAKTAAFVAQWAGDEDSAGDGSSALVVRTKRR